MVIGHYLRAGIDYEPESGEAAENTESYAAVIDSLKLTNFDRWRVNCISQAQKRLIDILCIYLLYIFFYFDV